MRGVADGAMESSRLSTAGRRAGMAALLAVLAATVASRVPFLNVTQIDWDEGVYWISMQSMRGGHGLFSQVYSSQPPAFLGFAEPAWALLGGGIGAARLLMLLWWLAAIAGGAYVAWRLGGLIAALAAAAILSVDPLGVRQSIVLQPDGPATALAVVALALGLLAVTARRPRRADVLAGLAGAALALGELTKLFDVAVLPALAGLLLFSRHDRGRLAMAAGAGAVVAAAAVMLPLVRDWAQVWAQSIQTHLGSRTVTYGIDLKDALLGHGWPVLGAAAAGLLVGWRWHPRLVLVGALWTGGSLVTLAELKPLWLHHSVLATPGLALLGAAGVSTVVGWLTNHLRGRGPAVVLTAAAAAGAAGVLVVSGLGQLPRAPAPLNPAVVAALEEFTPARGFVLGDDQFDAAAAGRQAPPQYVDTSITRMVGQALTAGSVEASLGAGSGVCAVLFESGRLDSLPGFETWVSAHFPERVQIPPGAVLFVRPGCAGP